MFHLTEINTQIAELIGIIIGDGCIRYDVKNPQYFVEITGNINLERTFFNYIANIFSSQLGLKSNIRIGGRGLRLRVSSKQFLEWLVHTLEMPYNKNKCLNIKIPSVIVADQELLFYCLRGIVDTDGSLFLSRKGPQKDYPCIEITTASKPLAMQLREILPAHLRIGFRNFTKNGFATIYKISINGDEMVDLWVKLIGFSNPRNGNRYIKLKSGSTGI